MKLISFKIIGLFALLAFFLGACGNDMQQSEEDMNKESQENVADNANAEKMEMEKVLDSYFDIKNALISSDIGTAMIATNKLKARASGKIASLAEEMNNMTDLKGKRQVFEKLSEELYATLKSKGGNEESVYKIYCPMAFDNKGAFWLSEENEVKNPYFGDEMLNCGEVKEELAAK